MNLLDEYLKEVNDYPKFKRSTVKKWSDKLISHLFVISLGALLVKMLAEWLMESMK